jgi:hypothetical protein
MKASRKKRSDNDPEMAPGGGVFVNEELFQEFLKKHSDTPQVYHVLRGPRVRLNRRTGRYPDMRD